MSALDNQGLFILLCFPAYFLEENTHYLRILLEKAIASIVQVVVAFKERPINFALRQRLTNFNPHYKIDLS